MASASITEALLALCLVLLLVAPRVEAQLAPPMLLALSISHWGTAHAVHAAGAHGLACTQRYRLPWLRCLSRAAHNLARYLLSSAVGLAVHDCVSPCTRPCISSYLLQKVCSLAVHGTTMSPCGLSVLLCLVHSHETGC